MRGIGPERPLALYVSGAANAPNLVQFLDQNNVDILDAPDNAEAAVRRGDLDVVLVIPDDFGEQFTDGVSAQVQLLVDRSNTSGSVAISRTESLIRQYSNQIGNLRLIARGISPAISNAVAIETVDIAPQASGDAGFVLNLAAGSAMTSAANTTADATTIGFMSSPPRSS